MRPKQRACVSGRQADDIPGVLVTEFPGDYEWLDRWTLRVLAVLDPVLQVVSTIRGL